MGPGGISPQNYDLGNNPLYKQAVQATQSHFGQFDPTQYEQLFQQGVANPTLRNYEQEILPLIRGQFGNQFTSPGSGLNQALAQSAQEVGTRLGELRSKTMMGAQESHMDRQLNAIAKALGLAEAPGKAQQQQTQDYFTTLFGARPTEAMIRGQQPGWAQDLTKLLVEAGAKIGSAFIGG